jgi:hypothetical protein
LWLHIYKANIKVPLYELSFASAHAAAFRLIATRALRFSLIRARALFLLTGRRAEEKLGNTCLRRTLENPECREIFKNAPIPPYQKRINLFLLLNIVK